MILFAWASFIEPIAAPRYIFNTYALSEAQQLILYKFEQQTHAIAIFNIIFTQYTPFTAMHEDNSNPLITARPDGTNASVCCCFFLCRPLPAFAYMRIFIYPKKVRQATEPNCTQFVHLSRQRHTSALLTIAVTALLTIPLYRIHNFESTESFSTKHIIIACIHRALHDNYNKANKIGQMFGGKVCYGTTILDLFRRLSAKRVNCKRL